jgi:hypothetical protein
MIYKREDTLAKREKEESIYTVTILLHEIPPHVSARSSLTLCNTIFLPTTYSPALISFGRERGWRITCNYPTVLKEKNIEKQKENNLRYLLAKVRTT